MEEIENRIGPVVPLEENRPAADDFADIVYS